MKTTFFFLLILLIACNQADKDPAASKDSTTVITYDTIPEVRTSVKTNPVAEYSEPIKDELNKWTFSVSLYETERMFHFTMRIRCKEVRVSDSVNIPNFGIYPKVGIRKGKEPLTCIIGFFDKKGEFREYRKVSFKNEQLHLSTVNNYAVGIYHTKK